MYPILEKRRLNETTTLMRVLAPRVAKKAGPGQFIILRIDENGERIPLTIAGYDRESGSVTIIFQKVGKTTIHLDELNAGDSLLDFVGPLGRVSEYGDVRGKRVAVIGGGLGIAIAYPQAVALTELGAEVDMIVGFRNIGLAILECPEAAAAIQNGDEVTVDFDTGVITDVTTGESFQAQPFPPFIQNIIEKGGLLNSL